VDCDATDDVNTFDGGTVVFSSSFSSIENSFPPLETEFCFAVDENVAAAAAAIEVAVGLLLLLLLCAAPVLLLAGCRLPAAVAEVEGGVAVLSVAKE